MIKIFRQEKWNKKFRPFLKFIVLIVKAVKSVFQVTSNFPPFFYIAITSSATTLMASHISKLFGMICLKNNWFIVKSYF